MANPPAVNAVGSIVGTPHTYEVSATLGLDASASNDGVEYIHPRIV
jgi:hypothetical protein